MNRLLVAVAVVALASAGWAMAQSKPSGAAAIGGPTVPPAASASADRLPASPTATASAEPAAPAAAPTPAAKAVSPAGVTPAPAATPTSQAGVSAGASAKAEAFRQARARARTRQALAGKPKLEFTDTPLKAVLDYLAEIGNFSIVYDPALEEAGIDLAAVPVSITASGLSYESAIRLLLPKECGYRIEAGYVLVTTLEKSWIPLKTVSYSIQVTMAEIPDFGGQAPRFEIANLGKAGGGGAAPLFGAAPAKEEAVTPPSPDRIIEFVKKFARHADDRRIAPWDDEGGPATIQYLSGHLVISQTEFGHHAVARLLALIE